MREKKKKGKMASWKLQCDTLETQRVTQLNPFTHIFLHVGVYKKEYWSLLHSQHWALTGNFPGYSVAALCLRDPTALGVLPPLPQPCTPTGHRLGGCWGGLTHNSGSGTG